jgi:hypothetical protein
VDLKVELFVDGENEIAVGDFLTQKFTITQTNLGEHDSFGFVHSNEYPLLKKSNWYIMITDREENGFFYMEQLSLRK